MEAESTEQTQEQTLEALQEKLQEKEREVQELREQMELLQKQNQNPVSPPEDNHDLQTPSTSRAARQVQESEIIILIDSNGKFINEKKLFPKHEVNKINCPNTEKALELLTEEKLGSPSHIIIHTGSSDLRKKQERLSESLERVIEKASDTFPSSRVVMSALLPRRDLHFDTIHNINTKLEKACHKFKNVYFAKHPTLGFSCLHDDVNLSKEKVPIFARTLKDVALDRNPSEQQGTVQGRSSLIYIPRQSPPIFFFNFN
ncbi:uncharacterized protein LOC115797469 [Archocentrus centrarchus]|uniref:uncharacterized protein LOC115797469 n=1 Tax=Archocentrus centrarchus TaxID=63155 RepID=UPI0011EA360E|nr:uncharacterized protein LOC115797469 [Archocentrus centrarchus]